jgi:multidrug efflux pump subunit AcrB
MKGLIQFFLRRPIWGNAIIVMVIMFGLFSVFTMKRSFFPELDPFTIVVNVFYPGASPSEMEEGVTIKIEQSIKGLAEIEEINSTSSENMATVTIKAYTDTDMDELLSDVENSINSINSFPQGAERPIIRKLKSSGMGSMVAFVGISAKSNDISDIEIIDKATQVERDLLNTKQITQIEKNGFPTKEISVNVRETDLLRYGLTFQEVSSAISSKNIDLTAGLIRGGVQEMSIRANDRGTTEKEIEAIPLRSTGEGEKILVGDVADVVLGYSEDSQEAKFNGKPAVSFRIEKTPEQDIKKISDEIHLYQEKFNKENPDFQFDIYYEFNNMLNARIDLLTSNGITGLVLVLVFLGLFLNIKLSAWVAFGIPFSFLGMFIIGIFYGMTINMISLFGMILVVGILVDDGIVIAENIYSHYEKGKSARQAALDGTLEVLTPVLTSVITTIVAFSLLFYIEGMEMMREMAFVAIACLTFSLYEAFFMLPAHLSHKDILTENEKPPYNAWLGVALMVIGIVVIWVGSKLIFMGELSLGGVLFPFLLFIIGAILMLKGFSNSPLELKVRGTADRGIKWFRDIWFKESVDMIVGKKFKWYRLTFFLPMIFTVVTLGLFMSGTIGATFFPNIPPDFFNVEVAYNPGDNKAQTERFIDQATRILLEENKRIQEENGDSLMTYFSSNIGFSQNLGQNGNHTGALSVFVDTENSKTPLDTLMGRVIRRIKALPEGMLAQETYVGGFNRFGKEIEVGLTSTNEGNLEKAQVQFKKELGNLDGVINIKDNMPPGRMEVNIKLKPQAEMFGITKGEVLSQIRQGFFGQEAQRIIIGTDEVKIWVRYPKEDRNSLLDLENMKVKNAAGVAIPLNEICYFEFGRAPESIKRRNGQRIIRVDAESTDRNMVAGINGKIFSDLMPKIQSIYPDVQAVKLGQFERSQKAGDSMKFVVMIVIVLMFIVIMLHFNSLSQAFLIMLVIPAGLAGAIMGHGLVGIPVSILSAFGMIALLGVLVNDAIVYLDRYNDLIVEGYKPREAVIEAATSRFRPILLTSLTTVAGLMPMIAEKSMQAQFLIPMATSIAFGVLFGTIFILFFYPAAILFWNDLRRFFKMVWRWEKIDQMEVEPAYQLHKKDHENESAH